MASADLDSTSVDALSVAAPGAGAGASCLKVGTRWHGRYKVERELPASAGGSVFAGQRIEDGVAVCFRRLAASADSETRRAVWQALQEPPLPGGPVRRQLRWARLRRSSFPAVYAPEVLSGGFLPLIGLATLAIADIVPFSLFLGVFVAWYGAEMALAKRYDWPVSARIALMMILRDLLTVPLWIGGWTGNKFVWRGNAMDIKTSGDADLPPLVERLLAARTMRAVIHIVTGRRPVADMERGNGASRGG